MRKEPLLMKLLKLLILLGLPTLTLLFYFTNSAKPEKLIFSAFILFVIFERTWEGLYTSKDNDMDRIEGDWTLPASTISYIVLIVFCLIEFYSISRKPILCVMLSGVCIYAVAIFLRLWAVVSLGDQWSVHIIGKDKLSGNRRLIMKGPYKYIRHPVYLGIILEQVGIPLVFNLFYTAIIIGCISVALQLAKSNLEEGEMQNRLGEDYKDYIRNTPRFNPFLKLIVRNGRGR